MQTNKSHIRRGLHFCAMSSTYFEDPAVPLSQQAATDRFCEGGVQLDFTSTGPWGEAK
ncbi:unnamed protein product [Protopolystoma xenopodis]|uniref:Uncharacterized protein n=1 Tax=Protopolystoma xenopodis TaxID=117903 RepID=A0A3S5B608_9PLAT|nr:unnamed protein product [Protopolystoma xenopodis]